MGGAGGEVADITRQRNSDSDARPKPTRIVDAQERPRRNPGGARAPGLATRRGKQVSRGGYRRREARSPIGTSRPMGRAKMRPDGVGGQAWAGGEPRGSWRTKTLWELRREGDGNMYREARVEAPYGPRVTIAQSFLGAPSRRGREGSQRHVP